MLVRVSIVHSYYYCVVYHHRLSHNFIYPTKEKAVAPHSSTLGWKIPWMEEPGRLQSMGSLRVELSDFPFTFHFHALEKEMATHSSVLAWRIPGMGEPGGLLSMGSHRVGHDWSDVAHTQHARPKWHYCIYCNIYSSTIQDSTNLETTHPSAREWTDKQWNNLTVKYHIVIKIY